MHMSCRITQLYEAGVAVYFYFAFYFKGVAEDPSRLYSEIEHAARDEVLRQGGSLSHHHGIGKIRQSFVPRIASPGTRAFALRVKEAVDPTNVFAAKNQLYTGGAAEESDN